MKRFITMIVAACAFFAVSAQHPMVTLSHDGELTLFTGITALNSAVEKAISGDTVFLSEGNFILSSGKLDFPAGKRISIVGHGYKSHIMGEVTLQFISSTINSSAPLFDGVRIEKLTFKDGTTTVSNRYTGSSEIRNSWIKALSGGAYAGKNITYDRCSIDYAGFGGYGTVSINNSKIRKTEGNGFANLVNLTNCHVDSAQYYPKTMVSSILNSSEVVAYESTDKPIYLIYNSILKSEPGSYSQATVDFTDCLFLNIDDFFDENLEITDPSNANWNKIKGLDGTDVGIYGGEFPFTENPSVPTVDTANSSVEYDAENNKLKVSITVKAD